jgi:hypothetical protein
MKNIKYYFDVDQITMIEFHLSKESTYKWFQVIPEKPIKFLGFKIGTKASVPAGWSCTESGYHRVESSYFNEYDFYRVDETNKKVYAKPNVTIYLKSKQEIFKRFEYDNEARNYIDELIKSTDKKFMVIEK